MLCVLYSFQYETCTAVSQSWLIPSEVPGSTGVKLNSVVIIFLEITQNYLSVALKGLKVVAPL